MKGKGWVLSTYFAQGFPFTVVRILSSVFFTDIQAKERYIGYLNFLGVPWNFKFLWAPFLDSLSSKRKWQISLQWLISLVFLAMAVLCFFARSADDKTVFVGLIVGLFVIAGFLAATQDIAIDAFYMEGLPERSDQAAYSGHRVMAYRLAVVYARSGIVALVAFASVGPTTSEPYWPWCVGFTAAALTMVVLAAWHSRSLPRTSRTPHPAGASSLDVYRKAFASYLQQDKIWLILVFIVAYKMGDEILFSMNTPFLKRELGLTNEQYAWVSGLLGAVGAVLGAIWGGKWIKRAGLRRAILPLTLLMNLNIIWYIFLAVERPDPTTALGISAIATVHFVEQIAAGLGSAALLVFLLGTCKAEFKAAHYAIGSAIMSLPATVVGGLGGLLVERVGYSGLFGLALVASLPSFALLPLVPIAGSDSSTSKRG